MKRNETRPSLLERLAAGSQGQKGSVEPEEYANMTRLAERRESVTAGSKHKPKTRQEFAEVITKCWRRTVRNVIKAGQYLLDAEVELKKRGEFTKMINNDLPFGDRVAQRLMAIARHEVLSDPTHESGLPRS